MKAVYSVQMQWLLAVSQFAVLAALVWRGAWRRLPCFTAFIAFAIVSTVTYNPYNRALFLWMSIPSIILRGLTTFECGWLLTLDENRDRRLLALAAALIGGFMALSAAWGFSTPLGLFAGFVAYCALAFAGALWTLIGMLWINSALVKDWRSRYALALGFYFGILAIARVSRPWWLVQNISMWAYIAIFFWLAKYLFDQNIYFAHGENDDPGGNTQHHLAH